MNLTKEEKSAVACLKRLGKRWPKRLWLFSASGNLKVMIKNDNGGRLLEAGGGMDRAAIVADIEGIENDGGDW